MDFKRLVSLRPTDQLTLKELLSLVKPTTEIEEKVLALNLIGVLSGFEASLFECHNGQMIPKSGLSLRNISEQCSRSVLRQYSEYGERISELLQSITNFLGKNRENTATLISYALCCRDIINDHILKELLPVCSTEKFSINLFSDFITGPKSGFLLDKLNVLHEIDQLINQSSHSASEIINLLQQNLYLDRVYGFNLISQLLLACLRPTLDYLESLLTLGEQRPQDESFFSLVHDLGPDDFWDKFLKTEKELPTLFSASHNLICMGIKSRRIVLNRARGDLLHQIRFPRGSLFKHFLENLQAQFGGKSYQVEQNSEKKPDQLCLRLEKLNHLTKIDYKFLDPNGQVEVNAIKPDFSGLDYHQCKFFLPTDYTSCGVPAEFAIEKSLSMALHSFIDPVSDWLVEQTSETYLKSLDTMNKFYLLQKSNSEMKMYLDALFTDVTDNLEKDEVSLNWRFYHFSDHKVQAFLSQQNLSEKEATSLTILRNVHLVYEDLDWTTRVIVDTNAKQIYDEAFGFLLRIIYSRWLLEKMSYFAKSHLRQKLTKELQHLYLIRHHILYIINGVYNFIMNNLHQYVAILWDNLMKIKDYQELREEFRKFILKVERITMQTQSENDCKIVRSLIRKFAKLIGDLWKVWNGELNYDRLPSASELDNFEKGFRIYLFHEDFQDETTFIANH
ncbi:uncharacterized protein LOC141858658 [Brevipalpus obovatus]|uniref:uncharacterized protein LOC141858658 n=1 Tax=Brevipalpus obovatus TaxID=246614 RepID=UPI003D9E634E